MNSIPAITEHHWTPFAPMVKAVELLAEGKRVLEIGPGLRPFAPASVFVDWTPYANLAGKEVHVVDIGMEPLPFPDQSFDFIYCRHTLEDLHNPIWVCREMARVGRAGYIETPSPLAECSRGVDSGSPPWRGYAHHRYVVWVENDTLLFLPKYPRIELLDFGPAEAVFVDALNASPMFWNTHCFWEGTLRCRMLPEANGGFRMTEHYGPLLLRAANECLTQTASMTQLLLDGADALIRAVAADSSMAYTETSGRVAQR